MFFLSPDYLDRRGGGGLCVCVCVVVVNKNITCLHEKSLPAGFQELVPAVRRVKTNQQTAAELSNFYEKQ